ncbi:MAG: hypothetical protein ABR510_10435 [Trueperaceae bacterium]
MIPTAGVADVATGADASAAARAVADLRRRTLGRAARGYAVWVGRAVGWWTIGYLVFWVVVFGIAAFESLPTLDPPLPAAVAPALAGLASLLAFAPLALAGRAPPVALDRRDLYRLALSAAPPYAVLRWRLRARRVAAGAVGAVAGGAWSLLAPALAGTSAPWAAPALALAAVAWVDLGWLRYAGYRRPDEDGREARRVTTALLGLAVAGGAAGALLGVAIGRGWAALGPAGALASASPLVLALPALLALVASAAVRRSLASSWPPRFAPQSLVLTQLQAMRTFQWIARAAGLPMRGEADAFVRDRLLAALFDRPDAVRPRRSLRPPPATAPLWRAFAWRAASAWVRRRTWPRLASLATTLGAAAGALAAGVAASPRPTALPESGFVTPGDAFGQGVLVAAVVFGAAWWAARAWGSWLGPSLPAGTLPVDPGTRTAGRLAVGGAALALGLGLAALVGVLAGLGPTLAAAWGAALLLATVGVVLEKYGTWSGVGAGGWEAQLVAALVAAAPTMLAVAFGAPGLAPIASALVLAVAWVLPV